MASASSLANGTDFLISSASTELTVRNCLAYRLETHGNIYAWEFEGRDQDWLTTRSVFPTA